MQADIGRATVQVVIFGDRDLKRRLLAEPQRAAEADHDPGSASGATSDAP